MNVFIVNGSSDYRTLFLSMGFSITNSLEDAGLVCFTGGSDVSPSLYGAKEHPFTGASYARDMQEQLVFLDAVDKNIPCVGICRGAQFLNVMSGGAMYQHVDKHTSPHTITDLQTGESVYVSSTHHQMMKPSPEGLLVASSTLGGFREWYDGQIFKKDVSKEDVEVVFYKHTKCLCFQPHPEFDDAEYEGMRVYFRSLLVRYLEV